MTKVVPTNTGKTIITDSSAPPWIFGRVWSETGGYAKCNKDGIVVCLHRIIAGAKPGDVVDHINGDTTDCRRSNLRICNHAENSWNRKCGGVTCVNGYWQVAIRANGKNKYLGRYKTFDEARKVRIAAEVQRSSEFVRTWDAMTEEDYWANRRVKPRPGEKPWEKKPPRNMRGSANGNSRFTEEQIRTFKSLVASGSKIAVAARAAGISTAIAYRIHHGNAWAWVS